MPPCKHMCGDAMVLRKMHKVWVHVKRDRSLESGFWISKELFYHKKINEIKKI